MKTAPRFAIVADTTFGIDRTMLSAISSAEAIRDAIDAMTAADIELRERIAILYPPLPPGYWWVRETAVQTGFTGTEGRIRYMPMYEDDITPGMDAWRP